MHFKLILLAVSLVFSALFSGAETALTAVRRIKLDVWVKQGVRGAGRTHGMIQHPDRFLVTTLVGNNLAVVAASSLMAVFLESSLSGIQITLVSSLIILFWCEILPKSIAAEQPTRLSLLSSLFIQWISLLLYPFIRLTRAATQGMIRLLGFERSELQRVFSRKDFAHVLDEGHQKGVLGDEDRELISRFILRSDCKLREIMIPRTEMAAVEKNADMSALIELFGKSGYSRLPVFEKNLDHICGIVTVHDVLLERPSNIEAILRPAFFLPDLKQVLDSLQEMQDQHVGMAIVVDEYGGTAGLVTLEDMVEEFFGEILDEFDKNTDWIRKAGPDAIEVNARVEIDVFNKHFDLEFEAGDYQTLSGLLMAEAGRIPRRGESFVLFSHRITILSSTRRKINWVRITKE